MGLEAGEGAPGLVRRTPPPRGSRKRTWDQGPGGRRPTGTGWGEPALEGGPREPPALRGAPTRPPSGSGPGREEKALPGASVATGDPALIPLLTPPHGARVWTVTFPLWPAQWKPLAGWEGTWGRPSWAVTLTMYSHKPQPTPSHNGPADTSSATPQATRAGHSSCERNREGWRDRPTEPGWPEWTLGTRPRPPPSLPQPCPASGWQGPRSPLETAPSHGH